MSLDAAGRQLAQGGTALETTPDGHRVVFLGPVAGDEEHVALHLRDTVAGTTQPLSVDGSGAFLQGWTYAPALSDDGTRAVFATYPYGGATPGLHVRDLVTGATTAYPVGEVRDLALSGDGRTLVYTTARPVGEEDELLTVHLRDLSTGTVRTLLEARGWGGYGGNLAIDRLGRYVALDTTAGLVAADDNEISDVYVLDTRTARPTLVSTAADGGASVAESRSPDLSADGSRVAWLASGPLDHVSSPSGAFAAALVRDWRAGTPTREASAGLPGVPVRDVSPQSVALSGDGSTVAIANSVDGRAGRTWVRVLATGTTREATGRGADATGPLLGRDGRTVVFTTESALVADDTNGTSDAYVHRLG